MHHVYMHHGYMHHGYMPHGNIIDICIIDSCIIAVEVEKEVLVNFARVTRPERPKGAKDEGPPPRIQVHIFVSASCLEKIINLDIKCRDALRCLCDEAFIEGLILVCAHLTLFFKGRAH